MTHPDDNSFGFIGDLGNRAFLSRGLTKREYFAVLLCAGMNANPDISKCGSEAGHSPSHLRQCYAESAVKQADALILALNEVK